MPPQPQQKSDVLSRVKNFFSDVHGRVADEVGAWVEDYNRAMAPPTDPSEGGALFRGAHALMTGLFGAPTRFEDFEKGLEFMQPFTEKSRAGWKEMGRTIREVQQRSHDVAYEKQQATVGRSPSDTLKAAKEAVGPSLVSGLNAIPYLPLGSTAESIYEQFASGDVAGGLGTSLAIAIPMPGAAESKALRPRIRVNMLEGMLPRAEKTAALETAKGIKAVERPLLNASGESAASMEAIRRVAAEKSKGVERVRIDTRSGRETPLFGVDAVDAKPGPYEVIVQRGPQGETILDRGAQARDLPKATKIEGKSRTRTFASEDGGEFHIIDDVTESPE